MTTVFESLVREAGQYARAHGTGLLLSVDEAHVVERHPDLSALSRSMQTAVTTRLPLAVLLVGLPALRERFVGAGTFIQRLQTRYLEDLSPDAARLALVEPAARQGVHFAPDALELLVARANGRPYHVQLFGYHAWRAGGGAIEINLSHAQAGLRDAYLQLGSEFGPAWAKLRPQERDYLVALCELGPYQAATDKLAARLSRTTRQLSTVRDRLINQHQVLEAPEFGVVRFRVRQFADWVKQREGPGKSASAGVSLEELTDFQTRAIGPGVATEGPGRGLPPDDPARGWGLGREVSHLHNVPSREQS